MDLFLLVISESTIACPSKQTQRTTATLTSPELKRIRFTRQLELPEASTKLKIAMNKIREPERLKKRIVNEMNATVFPDLAHQGRTCCAPKRMERERYDGPFIAFKMPDLRAFLYSNLFAQIVIHARGMVYVFPDSQELSHVVDWKLFFFFGSTQGNRV